MRYIPRKPVTRGFTLIELLVVVTIITVLLALLLPAVAKAIYQAELAVCGARLNGLGLSVTTYAMQNKRFYPVRGFNTPHRQPHRIVGANDPNLPTQFSDERVTLRGYVDMKLFLDPLTAKIELENTAANADVYTPYVCWYGWRYLDPNRSYQQFPGMHRLGDRFVWNADAASPTYRFNVLASDYDEVHAAAKDVISSHPDRDNVMVPQVLENAPYYGTLTIYISRWVNTELVRGPLDLNFAMADGSVIRFNDVKLSESNAYPYNKERQNLVPAPQKSEAGNNKDWYTYLPAAQ